MIVQEELKSARRSDQPSWEMDWILSESLKDLSWEIIKMFMIEWFNSPCLNWTLEYFGVAMHFFYFNQIDYRM